MQNKKGALEFSMGTIIVVVLALLALSLFFVILSKVMGITSILPVQQTTSSNFLLESQAYPESGPIGTIFKISASSAGKKALSMQANIGGTEIFMHDDGINGDPIANDGNFTGTFDSSKVTNFGALEGSITADLEDSSKSTGKFSLEVVRNTCNPILINGDPSDKVDLVMIGANYSDINQFNVDVFNYIDINETNKGLLSFEPFKSESQKFNIYSISKLYSLDDLGCVMGCHGVSTMVCCDDKKVVKAAMDCPFDQAIILINVSEFCASSSFYSKVCVNDQVQPAVLVHEFGHSFGNLGDEYNYDLVSGMDTITDYNYPNCVKDCSQWPQGLAEGCFKTCGYPNYYRSTDDSCIMNRLTDHFCPVCQSILQGLLSKYSSVSIQNSSQSNQKSLPAAIANFGSGKKEYVAELNYNSGNFTGLNEVYVYPSDAPDYLSGRGTYSFKVVSKENQIIRAANFSVINLEFSSNIEDNSSEKPAPIENSALNYTFRVPYFDNAKSIEIYNQNGELINTIDVSYFTNTCGNNICESNENYLSCPSDCKIESDHSCTPVSDGICDPDCKNNEDPDCMIRTEIYWLAVIIIVMITFILGFLVIKKLRRNN